MMSMLIRSKAGMEEVDDFLLVGVCVRLEEALRLLWGVPVDARRLGILGSILLFDIYPSVVVMLFTTA